MAGANQTNAINALTNLKTFLTGLETNHNIMTGDPSLDQETRRLLLVRTDVFAQVIQDHGSRAEATAAAAARKATTGVQGQVHEQLHNLDTFIKQIDAQVNALTNPTTIGRRVQNPLS